MRFCFTTSLTIENSMFEHEKMLNLHKNNEFKLQIRSLTTFPVRNSVFYVYFS